MRLNLRRMTRSQSRLERQRTMSERSEEASDSEDSSQGPPAEEEEEDLEPLDCPQLPPRGAASACGSDNADFLPLRCSKLLSICSTAASPRCSTAASPRSPSPEERKASKESARSTSLEPSRRATKEASVVAAEPSRRAVTKEGTMAWESSRKATKESTMTLEPSRRAATKEAIATSAEPSRRGTPKEGSAAGVALERRGTKETPRKASKEASSRTRASLEVPNGSEASQASWRSSELGQSEGVDMRVLLLDNSGSTRKLDGWALVETAQHGVRGVDTDRWGETASIAAAHAEQSARLGVRSQIVLLNPPSPSRPVEGRDYVTLDPAQGEQSEKVSAFLRKAGPCGNTPLTVRLRQLRLRLQQQAPGTGSCCLSSVSGSASLSGGWEVPKSPRGWDVAKSPRGWDIASSPRRISKSEPRKVGASESVRMGSKGKADAPVQQRLALTIVTDGLPTASDSTSSTPADKEAFVNELQEWAKEFQCRPVIRLTTDHMGPLSFYKRIKEEVDFKVVVLGNLHCEARRARCNAWLAYSPQVHMLREGGGHAGALARLPEGKLSVAEIHEVLEWLLQPEEPLPRDPTGLHRAAEQLLPCTGEVYNGRVRGMSLPVDLKLLKKALGLCSAAKRLKGLSSALVFAVCRTGF